MSKQGAEQFGRYLMNFIANSARYPDASSFARAAGISPSSPSRYINAKERPSVQTLEKMAPIMGVSVAELVAIAYPENAGDGSAPESIEADPIVAELAAMLDPASPLSEEDRDTIRTLVDRIIDPHRRQMRRRRSA